MRARHHDPPVTISWAHAHLKRSVPERESRPTLGPCPTPLDQPCLYPVQPPRALNPANPVPRAHARVRLDLLSAGTNKGGSGGNWEAQAGQALALPEPHTKSRNAPPHTKLHHVLALGGRTTRAHAPARGPRCARRARADSEPTRSSCRPRTNFNEAR